MAAKNIPIVSTATADSAQAAPTLFDINPPYANVNASTAKFKYLYDQGVRTAALVYIDVAQVKTQVNQQKAQMQAVGIKIVSEQAVPLSTLSYDAAARGVANSKADYVFYPAGGNLNASFARSMASAGYQPKFLEYLTAYGSNFVEVAGAAAEGAVNFIRSIPNEEAGSNKGVSQFIEWMGRAAPGVTPDTFAADSWASTKAFLDAVDNIPGPISREGLIAQLKTMKRYDADGFFGPINLGDKQSLGCFIAVRVVNGKWQRIHPAQGFACT
jgi:ABC-type branched-subunit amino acid transport system substrate-binding protein